MHEVFVRIDVSKNFFNVSIVNRINWFKIRFWVFICLRKN